MWGGGRSPVPPSPIDTKLHPSPCGTILIESDTSHIGAQTPKGGWQRLGRWARQRNSHQAASPGHSLAYSLSHTLTLQLKLHHCLRSSPTQLTTMSQSRWTAFLPIPRPYISPCSPQPCTFSLRDPASGATWVSPPTLKALI